jgi:hypothetical protein
MLNLNQAVERELADCNVLDAPIVGLDDHLNLDFDFGEELTVGFAVAVVWWMPEMIDRGVEDQRISLFDVAH